MHSVTIHGLGARRGRHRHSLTASVTERLHRRIDRLARRHERRVREALAEALERAVDELDRPLGRGGAAVPVDRGAVAEATPLLLQVALRLRDPGPLPLEVLRLSRSLVSDGTGPLYARSAHRSEHPPGTLGRFARAILAAAEAGDPAPASERGALSRS